MKRLKSASTAEYSACLTVRTERKFPRIPSGRATDKPGAPATGRTRRRRSGLVVRSSREWVLSASLAFDAIQVLGPPQEQLLTDHGRRGVDWLAQTIDG